MRDAYKCKSSSRAPAQIRGVVDHPQPHMLFWGQENANGAVGLAGCPLLDGTGEGLAYERAAHVVPYLFLTAGHENGKGIRSSWRSGAKNVANGIMNIEHEQRIPTVSPGLGKASPESPCGAVRQCRITKLPDFARLVEGKGWLMSVNI
jgi:hypothetical protein